MKQKNVYKKVLDYFKAQISKLDSELNDLNDRLNEHKKAEKDTPKEFASGQEEFIESAETDQHNMYRLLEKKIQQHKHMMGLVKEFEGIYKKNDRFSNVDFGCIFALQDSGKKPEYFLLGEGDDVIEIGKKEVWVCSRNSPMGRICSGKKTGEKVNINRQEYKVKEIL
jgi:transcription elongation GreA/GreB family factor